MEKEFKMAMIKNLKPSQLQAYIKHQIWLCIQTKEQLKESFQNGEFDNPGKFYQAVNYQNGKIASLSELYTDIGRMGSGITLPYLMPDKIYENPTKVIEDEVSGL